MIELFPVKCHDEILHCSVWAGVVMNHRNTPATYATSHILDRPVQFLNCVATDTCVDCGALRQEVYKQNAFSVLKHCAHDLLSWSGLLEFRLCWRWSVPPLHGLLLQFRGFVRHPCAVPCDHIAQEVFTFLTVLHQKVQFTGLPFQFVFFCQHLRHTLCTQFLKLKIIRHNFVKKWQCKLRKCRESDVMVNRLFSLIISSTAHTKSSLTTDSWPLHRS